jgi:putative nucleotide binding protein
MIGYRRRAPRREQRRFTIREPSMIVLDFMEFGNPTDRHFEHRNQPVAQGIGTKYFTLLEAVPLPAIRLEIFEEVELGPHSKVRKPIMITYDDLTSVSRTNLDEAVRRIILKNEKYFVEFFNIAEPVTLRLHALELLPGIGKKTMKTIIYERERKRFESFEDIKERTRIDPVKALTERIINELRGTEKYYLFVKPPHDRQGIYLGYLERVYGEIF